MCTSVCFFDWVLSQRNIRPYTVRKYLLATLPLFDNLVLVAGVALSAQAIDLLFSVKHSLTRATLHKYR